MGGRNSKANAGAGQKSRIKENREAGLKRLAKEKGGKVHWIA